MKKVAVLFAIIFLMIFPISYTPLAYGAAATIVSAEYTGSNEITIVFSVPVDWKIGDFSGIQHDTTTPTNPKILSIAETAPSSTVTITFGGTAVSANETGTIDIAAIADDGSGNTFAGVNDKTVSDGISPSVTTAQVFFADSISLTFDEPITNNSLNAADFTVSGVASEPSVSGLSFGSQAITLALDDSIETSDTTITLKYEKTSGSLNDSSGNSLKNFSNISVTNAAPTITESLTITTTSIVLIFDTDLVDATIDASDFTVAENTVTGAFEILPGEVTLTLGTALASNATPLVTIVGSITDVIGFVQTSGTSIPTDHLEPSMKSVSLKSSTEINVNFDEDLDGDTVAPSDFTVTGNTVVLVSESSGVVTLTLATAPSGTVTVTLVGQVSDVAGNSQTSGSLSLTILAEGDSKDTVVGAGGTATIDYSETKSGVSGAATLAVTLPAGTAGTISVTTAVEDDLEEGTILVTATDITAPCTNTCTIKFTVANNLLSAEGLKPNTTSIYHDSDENGLIETDEQITTTRDTATIPGSTIFTGEAGFTSKFAVGGVKALSTGAIAFLPPTLSGKYFENSESSPLEINGKRYDDLGFENNIGKQIINTGEPIQFKFTLFENRGGNNVAHFEFLTNLTETSRGYYDSDTLIIYERGEPLEIIDPHNLFANIDFAIETANTYEAIITMNMIFAKPMSESDIRIKAWDAQRFSRHAIFQNAIEVIGEPIIEKVEPVEKSTDDSIDELIDEPGVVFEKQVVVPEWIKNNASLWNKDQINDETFVSVIDFLIEEQIIDIPFEANASKEKNTNIKFEEIEEKIIIIPDWIKGIAGWWSDGLLTDKEFINSIKYLIKKEVVVI